MRLILTPIMRTYTGTITSLGPNQIFVFGSNTQGRHGRGSAKLALAKFGAIYGQARGLQGQSYAIVTKDLRSKLQPSISGASIITEIVSLYRTALLYSKLEFLVVYSGSGENLNAYTPQQMAYMFWRAGIEYGTIPDNIVFEKEFARLIELNNATTN